MRGDEILSESDLEVSEPITPDELIQHLLLDVVNDAEPDDLADEFINDFVLENRSETAQILAMFETPSETIVEILKGVLTQGYQIQVDALDSKGVPFIESLKQAVKAKMTQLASDTA
jgi:hypothetical protein